MGYSPWRHKRVGHDLVTKQHSTFSNQRSETEGDLSASWCGGSWGGRAAVTTVTTAEAEPTHPSRSPRAVAREPRKGWRREERSTEPFYCGLIHSVVTIPHDIKTLQESGCGTSGIFFFF